MNKLINGQVATTRVIELVDQTCTLLRTQGPKANAYGIVTDIKGAIENLSNAIAQLKGALQVSLVRKNRTTARPERSPSHEKTGASDRPCPPFSGTRSTAPGRRIQITDYRRGRFKRHSEYRHDGERSVIRPMPMAATIITRRTLSNMCRAPHGAARRSRAGPCWLRNNGRRYLADALGRLPV
jgi:hypothetical protein